MDLQVHTSSAKVGKLGKRNEFWYFRHNFDLTVLAIPAVVLIFLLCYLPMFGIIIAFKNYQYDLGIFRSPWVGFQNFRFFFESTDAFRITRNTIGYNLIYIVTGTSVALMFAIFLNEIARRAVRFYQTILFIPYFISWVVVGYLAIGMLDTQFGFLDRVFVSMGMNPVDWYSKPFYWIFILPAMHIWKGVGLGTLIYYTGIMNIDSEYYEAAEIDGATRFQMAIRITLPMLKKLAVMLITLSLGNIFRGDFGLHYFIPNNAGALYSTTDIIDTYVYRALRNNGDIPMSSAVSAFQSVVGLITILTANTIIKKVDEESSLF